MEASLSQFPWNHPCWDDYRETIRRLDFASFPSPSHLNALLPPGVVSGGGARLRFVRASSLPKTEYERHIYETGEVSTRERSWHDLFNALAWCRWPRLKAAMNAVHYRHLDRQCVGGRGPRRDALTLLDESGALVVSPHRDLLRALARREWHSAFLGMRGAWSSDTRVFICGHGLLEKNLEPWKAITAHALLLQIDTPTAPPIASPEFPGWLDSVLGERLRASGMCDSPRDLSPVPLAGIPGWWPKTPQDAAFYADRLVFRAPPMGFRPAPVHRLRRA